MSNTGTIVRIVPQRGFGFIKEDNGNELFFHASGTTQQGVFDSFYEGQQVTYTKTRDDRGRGDRAVDVQLAS